MTKKDKLVLQLILVQKALDLTESVGRLGPLSWTWTLVGKRKGIRFSRRRHGWKELRLCCYDLRVFFIPSDPLHHKKLTGLLGPIQRKENRAARDTGLKMLRRVGLVEARKEALRQENIPHDTLNRDTMMLERKSTRGYVHSAKNVATAYLYGQWAHSGRQEDFYAMAYRSDENFDFIKLNDFAYTTGHGVVTTVVAFCCELLGETAPDLSWDTDAHLALRYARGLLRRGGGCSSIDYLSSRRSKGCSTFSRCDEMPR